MKPWDDLELTTGSRRDYAALARHHYRGGRPVTATRVLVLRDRRPTVVGRYLGRGDQTQVVGVLVESLPMLACRMRDHALRGRYGTWLSARQRAMLLNREVRCISRVVIDPRWRGLGLAVRLVHAALNQPETMFTESLAAMGQVHPFFVKAGMTAYPRPQHAFDARLVAALRVVGLRADDLSLSRAVKARIDALPAHEADWLGHELRRWYRQTLGRGHHGPIELDALLRAARSKLLLEPVYYLKDNRAGAETGVAR